MLWNHENRNSRFENPFATRLLRSEMKSFNEVATVSKCLLCSALMVSNVFALVAVVMDPSEFAF